MSIAGYLGFSFFPMRYVIVTAQQRLTGGELSWLSMFKKGFQFLQCELNEITLP